MWIGAMLVAGVLSSRRSAEEEKAVSSGEIPKELIEVADREVHVEVLDVPDKHHHDPSNIIQYNGKYYLWYTQHPEVTNGWEGHIRLATSMMDSNGPSPGRRHSCWRKRRHRR